MLMRFSVSNFMSFGYRTDQEGEIVPEEFYLYAGRAEKHKERIIRFHDRKVLKFSSIYGANASGKTNLIYAMDAGRKIVLHAMEGVDYQEKYCRSRKSNRDKPTLFEYEFTIQDRCYAYGFTANLSGNFILSEWLYELNGEGEHTVFERIVETGQYYFDEAMFENEENRNQFHYFVKDVNRIKGSLLLYEIERRKLEDKEFEVFQKVYEWFQRSLVIIYPETKVGSSYFLFESDNKKLTDILDYLDTGITNYSRHKINEIAFKEYFPDEAMAEKILRSHADGRKIKAKSILNLGGTLFEIDYDDERAKDIVKLVFQHGTDESSYEYGEESDGTQRLIELLGVILNDDEEKVFVIDELDRSLHPQMTIKFVETFLRFSENRNSQLLITTHESNLMDLNILRRDEIWFAEKGSDNTTSLYPLEKFKIRYDKVVAKDYLAGRYGAVPVFKDFEYVWGRS